MEAIVIVNFWTVNLIILTIFVHFVYFQKY